MTDTSETWRGWFPIGPAISAIKASTEDPTFVVGQSLKSTGPFEMRPMTLKATDAAEVRTGAASYLKDLQDSCAPVVYRQAPWSQAEAATGPVESLDLDLLYGVLDAAISGSEVDADPPHVRIYAAVIRGPHAGDLLPLNCDGRWHMPNDTLVLLRLQSLFKFGNDKRLLFTEEEGRIKPLDNVIVYDGQFDVICFEDRFVALSYEALDKVFGDPTSRKILTDDAKTKIAEYFVENGKGAIDGAVTDPSWQAKIREIVRTDRLVPLGELKYIKDAATTYELDVVVDPAGKPIFPARRQGRWDVLDLLTDSYVQGAATQRLYRAASKDRWRRVVVVGVHKNNTGEVDALVDGDRTEYPTAVVKDLKSTGVEFVIRRGLDGVVHVVFRDFLGKEVLWASDVDGVSPNLLMDETTFAISAQPPALGQRTGEVAAAPLIPNRIHTSSKKPSITWGRTTTAKR